MKKKLQILTLTAALISCGTAMAQNSSRVIIPFNGTPGSLPAPSASGPEAVSCGPDALDYVYSKVDTLGMDSLFYFALWPTEKTSTAYANTQTVTITNVFVFGKVATGDPGPADMQVSIWNVNSNWQPTTMIAGATASLSIAQAASPAYHLFTFTTPVTVSDSFAVVLTNNDASDDFWAVASDGDPNTGAWLEGLSWYDWQGMWEPMEDVYPHAGEGLIIPYLTYSVTTDFTAANDSVCMGSSLAFTNTSTDLYWNRFFNLHAFSDQLLGEIDSTFVWDFGDASGNMYMNSGSHTYATPGTYTVSLTGTMLGYLDTCMETKTMVITVLGPAPGFTVDQSQEPTVSFTNTSTGNGTLSHAWDFGDGNTSTAQDPSHTYTAVGTYTVTLTTTDSCGSVTTTQTVTITTVGVNEVVSHDVKAFYNATEQTLNVTMPGSANAAVEVYNAVGAKIYAETGVNIATKVISLNSLAEGTYMVRVITAKGIGATKFVVIK